MEPLDLREGPDGVTLRVRVRPRAPRDAIGGLHAGALLVRLAARPVEGAANASLTRLLAGALGLPPSAVTLLRGVKGRDKLVHVAGVKRDQVLRLVGPPDART